MQNMERTMKSPWNEYGWRLEQAVYKSEYSNSHMEWRKSNLSSNQVNANYSELLLLHNPEWLKFKSDNSVNKHEKQRKHSNIASKVINLYSFFKRWLAFSPKVEEISRYVDKLWPQNYSPGIYLMEMCE